MMPGAGLDGQARGHLLALGGAGHQDRRRGLLGHELGQDLGLGRHRMGGELGGVGDVDRHRTVLGQARDRRVGAGAHQHGGGLADALGQGQQLVGDLLDIAVDVLDEHKYFSHCWAPQMNFCADRKSAMATPPLPSSVTIVPLAFGGRAAASSTTDHAAARPTSLAATPRPARSRVSTGFFLAAMMPLKDG